MRETELFDHGAAATDGESLVDLREYLRGLRQRWKLVLSVASIALAAAVAHYLITPPTYQAKTILQIERRSPTSLVNEQAPWLENLWNMEYYPTQYRLLESRGMAERVVKNLHLAEDPRLHATAARPPAAGGAPTAADDRAVLANIANRIRGGLSVEPVRGTQLVELTYHSSDPELAARIANGFAQAFIEWGIETQSVRVDRASNYLGEQIETLKEEIAQRERQIQALSRSEEVPLFNPDSDVTAQRLEALNEQFMSAKRGRIEREARYQELMAAPDLTVASSEPNGVAGSMMREQLRLERDYETKLKTYKPDWPGMVELKAEIDKGRQHLDRVVEEEARRSRQNAQAEYQTAFRQEQAIGKEIDELKQQMLENSSVAVQYNNLQVEVVTRRDLLDELMRKQSETAVAMRIQSNRESNIRVVDEALVPGNPHAPSLPRSLGAGLLAGLLLGAGGAFLLEFLDRSIKSGEEIERLLQLPVLAVIPDLTEGTRHKGSFAYGYGHAGRHKAAAPHRRLDKRQASGAAQIELVPHTRPRLAVSEAYRALRTALLLSSAEDLGVVAITSASAGEGKTVTSANLAVVMAQLGRRVLLIDGDLRKPRIHQLFRVSNRAGLVNYLTAGMEIEEVVHKSVVPNLLIIPSGPIPPNPSELLSSTRMRDLLETARERFDFVLIDTPPVLAVTDSTLVGALSDGVVLCLRAGTVLRDDARSCRNRLERADVKVLGAVLNAFRSHQGRYGKGHYYYYEAYSATLDDSETGSAA